MNWKKLAVLVGFFPGYLLAESTPYGVVRARLGNLRDNAYAVAVQQDGKILTVGASFNGKDSDMVLVRYLPDGAVDRTFADGGAFVYDSDGDDKGYGVIIDYRGRVVVAGESFNGKNTDFAVWRFTSTGKLDRSFGVRGVSRLDFENGSDTAYALAEQGDGRLVVAGMSASTTDRDFAILRFTENGAPDVTFGYNGKLKTALGDHYNRSGNETGYSLVIQPDGKIVLVGFSEVGGSSVMAAVRYYSDGRVDPSFGDKGSIVPQFGSRNHRAYTAALDSAGGILLGGTIYTGNRSEFALVRLNPDGRVDRYFGQEGLATAIIGGSQDTIYGLEILGDGSIVAAGSSASGEGMNLAIARFNSLGKLDPSFGDQGRVMLPGEGKFGAAYALALQSDGKIIAAGVSSHQNGYQIALARYQTSGSLDTAFGQGERGMQMARVPVRNADAMTAEAGLGGLFPR